MIVNVEHSMMNDKERKNSLIILFLLITRAECGVLDELTSSMKILQKTVDQISVELIKTTEKVDELKNDIANMQDANDKTFAKVNQLQSDCSEKFSLTSSSISALNKKIQNVEEKVAAANTSIFSG